MKKSIFILAALFAATFANAQIIKVWSGNIDVLGTGMQSIIILSEGDNFALIGPYFASRRETATSYVYNVDIIDATTLTTVKTFKDNDGTWEDFGTTDIYLLSKGIFSNDNKWACLTVVENGGETAEIQVRNEDGVLLATIPNYKPGSGGFASLKLVKVGNALQLHVPHINPNFSFLVDKWDIYSLPGDGSAQDFVSVTAPRKAARKILHNDQVRIENADKAYTLQGQEVR
jgi:hypothetical protein